MQTNRSMGGFTLIELLVTVVIFTIVIAIAIPVYQGTVRESRRSEARAILLDAANREHRFFADNGVFTANLTNLGFPNPALSQQGHYQITAVVGANGFTLTATPQGGQAADTVCTTLSLASNGTKSATGIGGGGACW
jgi:type IV pilus assembly protein PilE